MRRHSVTLAVTAGFCLALVTGTAGAAARAPGSGGTWGRAQEVPGTAALNTGGSAETLTVSCGAAGNCSAGGCYAQGHTGHAFVARETNGTWGAAQEVAAALNRGGGAQLDSVSCASAGNCSAGGFYMDSSQHSQAFVAGETNGTW